MMQETFYSIKEMAQHLNIDWETLLQWKYQYLFHLPAYREENQLKYPAKIEVLFQFIKEAKSAQLHDEIIQLWVDKQDGNKHIEHVNLTEALQILLEQTDAELTQLYCDWEEARKVQKENLFSILQHASWQELKQLQKEYPHLITLDEDTAESFENRSPVINLFKRLNYN